MSEQARQPAGVPTGGQFAASERNESSVTLTKPSASFLYPPFFDSAEEIVAFWEGVEIPDEVLARAERSYGELADVIDERWPYPAWSYEEWEWKERNPQPNLSDVGATADWEGRKRAAQEDYESALRERLAARPERLDKRDVRPYVQATAMWRAAAAELQMPGYLAVCNHELRTSSGMRRVRDIAFDSGLGAISSFFLDSDQYNLDGVGRDELKAMLVETVTTATNQQKANMDEALDDLSGRIGEGLNLVIDAGMTGKKR